MGISAADLLDFRRWQMASGKVGFAAFLMVLLASRMDGFDWRVFLLAGCAVFLMWIRNFWLVPMHIRFEQAEAEHYRTYSESDWIFVDAVGEMGGSEIDAMRDAFKAADNDAARNLLKSCLSSFDDRDLIRFSRFFLRRFVGDCDVNINEAGQLFRWE